MTEPNRFPTDDDREILIHLRLQVAQVATQLDALTALMESKFITHRTLLDSQAEKVALALDASEKAISKAEVGTERAILKAETANEKRFDSVNEFREQLRVQAAEFFTRREAEQALIGANTAREALAERIDKMEKKLDRSEGRTEGLGAGWSILIGAVGLVFTILAIVGIVIGTR